jgi:hypothetical protein
MSATEAPYFLRVKGSIWNCEARAEVPPQVSNFIQTPLGQQT